MAVASSFAEKITQNLQYISKYVTFKNLSSVYTKICKTNGLFLKYVWTGST